MTREFKALAGCAVLLALSACGGGDREIAAPVTARAETPAWFEQASPETVRAHFEQTCLAYGFEAETPQLDSCIDVTEGASRSLAAFSRID